jgi:hypothetical protein
MADDITAPIFAAPDPDAMVPLTAHLATPLAPEGTQPPDVTAAQLDNPPRVRANSAQTPTQLPAILAFAGLSFVDLLNLRMAMTNHLSTLLTNPEVNAAHIDSTKKVLAMASDKLAPRLPQEGLTAQAALTAPPAAAGVKPIPAFFPTKS